MGGLLKVVLLIGIAVLIFLTAVWFAVTQPVLPVRAQNEPSPAVKPARLEGHIRMLSETLFPRDWRHPENLDRVAAYIRKEFEQANGMVSEQEYKLCGNTYRNVMALFGPETKERIVVGAHYDAAGELPGADDNASGVAGLIELAYLLGRSKSLPMRVELVAFTLEEPLVLGGPGTFRTPYGGSARHAALLKEQGVPVRIMFSLEMIGFFRDAENSQSFPLSVMKFFYPARGNWIAVVGKLDQGLAVRRVKKAMRAASPLPVYSFNAPKSVEGIDWSDHSNYWKAGYTAVMVTNTALNRNTNYHTAQDTAETLDYDRMAMVVQSVYGAVLAFSQ